MHEARARVFHEVQRHCTSHVCVRCNCVRRVCVTASTQPSWRTMEKIIGFARPPGRIAYLPGGNFVPMFSFSAPPKPPWEPGSRGPLEATCLAHSRWTVVATRSSQGALSPRTAHRPAGRHVPPREVPIAKHRRRDQPRWPDKNTTRHEKPALRRAAPCQEHPAGRGR